MGKGPRRSLTPSVWSNKTELLSPVVIGRLSFQVIPVGLFIEGYRDDLAVKNI